MKSTYYPGVKLFNCRDLKTGYTDYKQIHASTLSTRIILTKRIYVCMYDGDHINVIGCFYSYFRFITIFLKC